MHVASLHSYPIKGCYRVDQYVAEVEPWGFAGDRRWLVVDDDGVAITQRDRAALTQIKPVVDVGGLLLRTDGLPELRLAEPVGGAQIDVQVWGFTGAATLAGAEADTWLAKALGPGVRLVWLDDPTRRVVNPEYGQPDDRVSFADGYPVLLANTASLASLNDLIAESGSLEGPLPMTRFRPNLVIDGALPWAEDAWTGRRIRVGEVFFRVPKPCDRCVVTTTDQETGERGKEPLRTLGTHRNINQGLMFATNMIPDNRGTITVGDIVEPV